MHALEKETIESALVNAESWSTEEVLRWAFTHFEDQAAIASAFGAEGIAMLDIAASLGRPFNVFTLDTGYLFPETHKLITDVQNIYGIQVERIVSSLTPEAQESIHGPTLWRRDPNLCCQLRKSGLCEQSYPECMLGLQQSARVRHLTDRMREKWNGTRSLDA